MPYDLNTERIPKTGFRAEVLELMSQRTQNPEMSESDFRQALRKLVEQKRHTAEELWDSYHGYRADACARAFAKYAY